MGLFDTIKEKLTDTLSNNEQVQSKIEDLKAQAQNGDLTAKGQEMLDKLRERVGK